MILEFSPKLDWCMIWRSRMCGIDGRECMCDFWRGGFPDWEFCPPETCAFPLGTYAACCLSIVRVCNVHWIALKTSVLCRVRIMVYFFPFSRENNKSATTSPPVHLTYGVSEFPETEPRLLCLPLITPRGKPNSLREMIGPLSFVMDRLNVFWRPYLAIGITMLGYIYHWLLWTRSWH